MPWTDDVHIETPEQIELSLELAGAGSRFVAQVIDWVIKFLFLVVLACLGATLGYGLAANFTKRYLSQVGALSVSTGSMLGAALLLSGPAFALLWGFVFLDEAITPRMLLGCAIVLGGTALGLGVVKLGLNRASAAP